MAKIALLIGVSEYLPEFPDLPSPVKDVEAMKEVLDNPEMGGFDDVKVLKNSKSQNTQQAIYELFADRNKDDVLLFYFSGHGVQNQEYNLYLATSDSSKDKQEEIKDYSAIAAKYLQDQMNKSNSQRLVVILDCCYSGAFTKEMTAKGDENIIKAELGGEGRAILMSSSSTQRSFESEGSELSIYTKYIVEGIKTGAADTDNNGKISADELHQYVSEKVKEESPAMTPQFAPVKEGYRIYLARSPKDDPKLKIRREVQEILRKNNGEISLLNHNFLEELSNSLGLLDREIEEIITEEKQPYVLFKDKLKRYEDAFNLAVGEGYPLSKNNRETLQKFQSLLGLRDEDIAAIEEQFLPQSLEPEPETFSTAKVIETNPQNNEYFASIEEPIIPQEQNLQNDRQPLPTVSKNQKFKFNNNFVAGIIGVGVLGISFFVGVPNISNLLTSTPTSTLTINSKYSTLEKLLKEKKWKEADEETVRLMLKVPGLEEKGHLTQQDIENFPCTYLRTIDQLWVENSNNKFGFSVQKKIYQKLGGTKEYDSEVWHNFGDEVGWRRKGEWLSEDDLMGELNSSSSHPEGHLPFKFIHFRGRGRRVPSLSQKLVDCNI